MEEEIVVVEVVAGIGTMMIVDHMVEMAVVTAATVRHLRHISKLQMSR